MKSLILVLGMLTTTVPAYSEQGASTCRDAKVPLQNVAGYQLRIDEAFAQEKDSQKKSDLQEEDGTRCEAAVVSELGDQIVVASDWNLSWLSATGTDVDGDGTPGAVLEGYSGGAHCCWTYWFISLGHPPVVYLKLENERGIFVDRKDPEHTYIRTLDGAFDYFDRLCHACTVFPNVILELHGRKLSDVGERFVQEYDQQIADAKKTFEHEDGETFAALMKYKPTTTAKYDTARAAALAVVFAYLYSGREERAWQSLDAMWPANDRARIKEKIQETRAMGILSQIGPSQGTDALRGCTGSK